MGERGDFFICNFNFLIIYLGLICSFLKKLGLWLQLIIHFFLIFFLLLLKRAYSSFHKVLLRKWKKILSSIVKRSSRSVFHLSERIGNIP